MRSAWAVQKPGGGLLCDGNEIPALHPTRQDALLDCWEKSWTPVKVRIIVEDAP